MKLLYRTPTPTIPQLINVNRTLYHYLLIITTLSTHDWTVSLTSRLSSEAVYISSHDSIN